MLPFIDEFLLNLQNNNYSKETVDNYDRDLEIFAAFIDLKGIAFDAVEKLTISEYKGFLRNDNYIPTLHAFQIKQRRKDKDPDFEDLAEKLDKEEEPIPEVVALESEKDKHKREAKAAGVKVKTSARDALYRGQLSSRSINRMLSTLRSYLSFLVDIDKDVPIPSSAVKLIKAEKKEKQVADLDELIHLIESPMEFERDPIVQMRNRAMLELIFATGMRISEVINLNREQIRFKDGRILDDRIYVVGKGKKQRFVYLTPRALRFLEEYLSKREDNYPAMFVPTKGTRKATGNPYLIRLSQNYLQMKIAEYRRLCGIIVPTSAHSLRHGFATYLAEEGANPAAIQRLLGHESLQTTTRYVHASDKFAEQAHRQFHPLQKNDKLTADAPLPETTVTVSANVPPDE
jgi:site-specific recombinase XerD